MQSLHASLKSQVHVCMLVKLEKCDPGLFLNTAPHHTDICDNSIQKGVCGVVVETLTKIYNMQANISIWWKRAQQFFFEFKSRKTAATLKKKSRFWGGSLLRLCLDVNLEAWKGDKILYTCGSCWFLLLAPVGSYGCVPALWHAGFCIWRLHLPE